MFGIGMPEMILILAVALIVIGPKKLPDLAKSLGRAIGEFRKATSELKESMEIDDDITDVKKTFDDITDHFNETIIDVPSDQKIDEQTDEPTDQQIDEPMDKAPETDRSAPIISGSTEENIQTPHYKDRETKDSEKPKNNE